MEPKIIKFTAIMLFLAGTFACVEKDENNTSENNEQCTVCNDTKVLRVLKDEPAYIRKGCDSEKVYFSYTIVLVDEDESPVYISRVLFPCGGVPEKFRIDYLPVLISGNILNCGTFDPCLPPCPECRLAPNNFLELKTIKTDKR
jgi:hypothetical protein